MTHICVSKLAIKDSSNYFTGAWIWLTWTLGTKFSRNKRNSYIFNQENASENVGCEMSAISSRPKCVKKLVRVCNCHLWLLVWICVHTTATVRQEAPHVLTRVASWHFRYIKGKPNEPKGISPTTGQFVRHLVQNTKKKSNFRRYDHGTSTLHRCIQQLDAAFNSSTAMSMWVQHYIELLYCWICHDFTVISVRNVSDQVFRSTLINPLLDNKMLICESNWQTFL